MQSLLTDLKCLDHTKPVTAVTIYDHTVNMYIEVGEFSANFVVNRADTKETPETTALLLHRALQTCVIQDQRTKADADA